MSSIDIIIPYVNCNDKEWLKEYKKYRPNTNPNSRYRETNTLKFQLRSIEKNLPWINNIFLVLSSKTQIPNWLNSKANNLKIIYHEDYIPSNLLPTFNSNVIELFYFLIPNLSENFILSNDDIIFTKYIPEENFFNNNRPVNYVKQISDDYKLKCNGLFSHIRYNSVKLFNDIVKSNKMIKYSDWHLAIPYKKSLWTDIWNKYYDELFSKLKNSKFRSSKNFNHWLFNYISMYIGLTLNNPNLDINGYYNVKDTSSQKEIYKALHDHPQVCLNDNVMAKFNKWDITTQLLEEIFPEKSKYEI